jgi:DNA-binding transcriptional MerR regulator
MKIREVSEQTGLAISTLRYYEQIGLITPVDRQQNSHRSYSETDVYQINFVMRLREAGMPIADIKRYVELAQDGNDTVAERLALLEAHQAAVEQKIDELHQHLAIISRKIAHYRESHRAQLGQNA